jgi:hypothetical protein
VPPGRVPKLLENRAFAGVPSRLAPERAPVLQLLEPQRQLAQRASRSEKVSKVCTIEKPSSDEESFETTNERERSPASKCAPVLKAAVESRAARAIPPRVETINRQGLERNDAGQRVYYLEVYKPDVLADEKQPVVG